MLDAFVFEPFSINQSLLDSFLLENDGFEVYVASSSGTAPLSGSGAISDPYLVSSTSAVDFDNLMATFGPYTTIHLAPGTYTTQGHSDGMTTGWSPRRGQRIVGAGVDITTLQLAVANPTADKAYFIIGADDSAFINGFEVIDLTLDANQGATAHANIAAGAIKVYGTHTRAQRVRTMNFGTLTKFKRGMAIVLAGAFPDNPEPFDCVVDACIVDQPFPNSVREVACITFAGGERATDGVIAFHKACVVRNSLIDCNYISNEVPFYGITMSGGSATANAKIAHGRSAMDWVVVTGALVNSSLANPFNGSYQLTSVNTSANTISYTPVSTPAYDANGDIYIGRTPCQRVAILPSGGISISGGVATVQTLTPHNRLPGQNVVLNNVGGLTPSINGSAIITDLGSTPSPTTLRFPYSGSGTPDSTNAWIGVDFYGIVTNGGRNVIVESNRILNSTFGVFQDTGLSWGVGDIYVQTGSTKDLTVRDNYLNGLLSAVYFKLGQVSGGDSNQQPTRAGASLTRGGAGNLTATFTTQSAHGFVLGQGVVIVGAKVGGVLSNYFNGAFQIISIPDPKSFTYLMTQDPGGNADSSPASKFGALWKAGRIVIEDNIVELILTITQGVDLPAAIRLDRVASTPAAPVSPYVFSAVVIRGNVIRHFDNASDPLALPMAIQLNSCENAIVEGNIVKLDRSDPVRFTACGSVKFFNNQAPSGALIQGYDTLNAQYVNELTTDADLSLILAT